MKLKNKLMLLLALTLSPINLFALDVEDTFTYTNAKYLLDGRHVVSTNNSPYYVITSTNNVKAKGDSIVGTSDKLVNSTKWVNIVKDVGGTPLDDIVKIVYSENGSRDSLSLFAINSEGVLYQSTNTSNIAKVIYDEEPVKDVALGSYGNNYNFITILTESGKILIDFPYGSLNSTGNFKELTLPSKATKILDRGVLHLRDTANHTMVLLENGDLYSINYGAGSYNLSTSPIPNVKDIHSITNTNNVLIWFNSGNVKAFNTYTMVMTDLDFGEGAVLDIVSDNGNDSPLIIKTDGVYTTNGASVYKTQIKETPISAGGNMILCDDGKYYKMTGAGVLLSLTEVGDLVDMQEWGNENPIPPNTTLASFKIDQDSILKRKDEYDLEFSLISKDKPTVFNLYYSKTNLIGDKANWKTIATNVPVDSLNPVLYETDYTDHNSNKVTGFTYTYKWSLTDKDVNLSGIQLIAEPVY